MFEPNYDRMTQQFNNYRATVFEYKAAEIPLRAIGDNFSANLYRENREFIENRANELAALIYKQAPFIK